MFKTVSKTAVRYFLFYFFVYIITAVGLSVITYCYIMPKYAAEVEQNAMNKMEYVSDSINAKFQELENLTYKIGINDELRRKLASDNVGDVFDGMSVIKNSIADYDIISDMIIRYDSEKDYFYTSNGKVSFKNMIKYEEKYNVCKKFIEEANNGQGDYGMKTVLHISENPADPSLMVICRTKPMPPYYNGSIIIYTISSTNIRNMIKGLYNSPNEGFGILSADGRDYITVGEKYGGTDEARKITDKMSSKSIGKEIVIVCNSQYSGLKYLYHVPKNKFFDGYIEIQITFIFGFVLISVLVLLLSMKFSKVNYKPIEDIYRALGKNKHDLNGNELTNLKSFVSEVVNEKNNIEAVLKMQEAYIKRQFLITVVKSGIKDEERLGNLITNTRINFYGKYFKVALVGGIPDIYEEIPDIISDFLQKKRMGYVVEDTDDDYIVLLLCYNDEEKTLKEIKEFFSDNFGENICYSFGRECTSLMNVNATYRQAVKNYGAHKNVSDESFEENEKEKRENYIKIMAYINENYVDNNLSLNLIADKIGKSIYYVSRLIKSNLGYNFMDYLSELRIEHAKKLLAETDMKISDIVEEIGYINIPGFNKKFKSIEGVSPTSYRKRYRENT